ncbi:hypothetical protein E2C01_060175 [Portunus trituberculatus]|uniref:Uncharacterized protein n=1 Tax=Portunus trituberculatus TaxID=210409 RepID=A0A5B7H4J8_PORTR|nr:hypothetical protein [Portunus trituberculatus]
MSTLQKDTSVSWLGISNLTGRRRPHLAMWHSWGGGNTYWSLWGCGGLLRKNLGHRDCCSSHDTSYTVIQMIQMMISEESDSETDEEQDKQVQAPNGNDSNFGTNGNNHKQSEWLPVKQRTHAFTGKEEVSVTISNADDKTEVLRIDV